MKKERDCNANQAPYPIYPAYQVGYPYQNMGMLQQPILQQPMMQQPMMNFATPNYNQNMNMQGFNQGTIEQQLSNLSNQVNSLERRVSNLENLVGNTTQYNTSNYQVM